MEGIEIEIAYVGFRVYRDNEAKKDDKGSFKGWKEDYDEWVPINSPRLMPFESKTNKRIKEVELEEDLDEAVLPE